jgi:hypothetical protein
MRLLDANATIAVWLGKSLLAQRETSSIRLVPPKTRTAQDLGKAAENVTQAECAVTSRRAKAKR